MTPTSQALRKVSLVVGSATILVLAYAGPAAADIPDGWSDPKPVPVLHFLLLFIGIPVLITLGIVLAIYVPGVVRRGITRTGRCPGSDQWLGGRRDTTPHSQAADREQDTGGAGGNW